MIPLRLTPDLLGRSPFGPQGWTPPPSNAPKQTVAPVPERSDDEAQEDKNIAVYVQKLGLSLPVMFPCYIKCEEEEAVVLVMMTQADGGTGVIVQILGDSLKAKAEASRRGLEFLWASRCSSILSLDPVAADLGWEQVAPDTPIWRFNDVASIVTTIIKGVTFRS